MGPTSFPRAADGTIKSTFDWDSLKRTSIPDRERKCASPLLPLRKPRTGWRRGLAEGSRWFRPVQSLTMAGRGGGEGGGCGGGNNPPGGVFFLFWVVGGGGVGGGGAWGGATSPIVGGAASDTAAAPA